jgi:hypothetical protein
MRTLIIKNSRIFKYFFQILTAQINNIKNKIQLNLKKEYAYDTVDFSIGTTLKEGM